MVAVRKEPKLQLMICLSKLGAKGSGKLHQGMEALAARVEKGFRTCQEKVKVRKNHTRIRKKAIF